MSQKIAMYTFITNGVCSRKINFELCGGKLHSLSFEGGCEGNLKAVGILAEDMDANELIQKLKGLRCGRKNTSCADQLAAAIARAVEKSP